MGIIVYVFSGILLSFMDGVKRIILVVLNFVNVIILICNNIVIVGDVVNVSIIISFNGISFLVN